MAGLPKPAPVTSVQFTFSHEACTLTCVDESGRTQVIKADIQGSYHENIFEDSVPNRALASAYWETPDTLALSLRWVEAVDLITYHFHFEGDVLTASFVPIIEASTRTETSLQGKLV